MPSSSSPSRIAAAVRSVLRRPSRTRDPRPRPEYYDGSETAELRPPTRYARGERAVPAPPPASF